MEPTTDPTNCRGETRENASAGTKKLTTRIVTNGNLILVFSPLTACECFRDKRWRRLCPVSQADEKQPAQSITKWKRYARINKRTEIRKDRYKYDDFEDDTNIFHLRSFYLIVLLLKILFLALNTLAHFHWQLNPSSTNTSTCEEIRRSLSSS